MRRVILIIVLAAGLLSQGWAQEQSPKVGLVLSGGGAKGMAHIGVLKVLEEVGIYPDYITGTSMGAVVGGLYAMGYTPAELEEIALAMDWDAVLTNQTKWSNIAIEAKPFYGRHQISLPMEKWSVGLPRGLIEGQELSKVLIRLTAPVHTVDDFDSLPRPFKCIGADIETGERVVLDKGFLPRAIRASMAIPTIFTPVDMDGKILVDGGLVHNFPVDEVIDMGADIIIGVAVSDSLVKADELNSLISILNQATFIMSVNNTLQQIQLVDYFIRPPTKPYTTGSFNDGDSIIARGEEEARRQYAMLKALADSLHQLRTFEPIVKPQIDSLLKIRNISVRGNGTIPEELVIGKMRLDQGALFSLDDIERRIDAVFGTRYFDRVTYEVVPVDDHTSDLIIDVQESSPGHAAFNVHYDTENGVGLNASLMLRNFGLTPSKLFVEADIAETPFLHAGYFVYTGVEQNLGVGIGTRYYADDVSLFDDNGNKEVTYKAKQWTYYLNFQSTHNQHWTAGLRVFSDVSTLKPVVTDSINRFFEKLRYTNVGLKPYAEFNNIDRRAFPNTGRRATISFTALVSMEGSITEPRDEFPEFELDRNLWSLDATFLRYFQLAEGLVLSTDHYLRFTNQEVERLNITDYHFAGGFRPNFEHTSAYWGAEKYEFPLTSFYLGNIALRYEPWRRIYFRAGINYLETQYPMEWIGPDYFQQNQAGGLDRRAGALLEAAFNSRLGPIVLSATKDFHREGITVFFSIGFNFKNFEEP